VLQGGVRAVVWGIGRLRWEGAMLLKLKRTNNAALQVKPGSHHDGP